MNSHDYIVQNFITLDQLAAYNDVSVDSIQAMIDAECLPGPAYRVSTSHKLTSIFGDYVEELDCMYFPRSYINLVESVARDTRSFSEIAASLKQQFYSEYERHLIAFKAADHGFANLFNAKGKMMTEAAEAFLQAEWQHYVNGTYGLCTNTASIEEIATKEAMVARIKFLLEETEIDRVKLEKAVSILDEVSSAFAPHEVERSSRGQYVDVVREKYFNADKKRY